MKQLGSRTTTPPTPQMMSQFMDTLEGLMPDPDLSSTYQASTPTASPLAHNSPNMTSKPISFFLPCFHFLPASLFLLYCIPTPFICLSYCHSHFYPFIYIKTFPSSPFFHFSIPFPYPYHLSILLSFWRWCVRFSPRMK